jgi:hypothetical protein
VGKILHQRFGSKVANMNVMRSVNTFKQAGMFGSNTFSNSEE